MEQVVRGSSSLSWFVASGKNPGAARKKCEMDFTTLLGLFVALSALIVGWRFAGYWSGELVDLPVLLLVIAGSFGTAVASSNMRTLASIPGVLRKVWSGTYTDPTSLIRTMVALARLVRVEGLLSLERILPDIPNKFLKRGIELVIDGRPSQVIREIMEAEMLASYQRLIAVENFFNTIGYLAPSFGAVATVSILSANLASIEEPGKVSSAVASSLCGVLYGLLLRTLVCVPIGRKLRVTAEEELITHAMVVEGILALNASENPRILQDIMSAFLSREGSRGFPATQRPLAETQARTGSFQRRAS